MNGEGAQESDFSAYVEVDPTGRYGRYNEVLGKGASKIVYRGFDEFEGIEVAWNQVKLNDFLQRPEDLERLYSEIHLLRTLKHSNIIKFYASWVDPAKRNINFVTEMFTSGTLRQYRLKHKKVNIRAVKHWCRQILKGLLYLHSLDPPVIHRDLKCDNIFINGNQGQVKIGDLGLAAILRKTYAAHCVGTPEFMAPEVYEEEYNELVDIYAFGMCVLEMITFEYPYSECTHPVQIYKKVISGKKPEALYKIKDLEVRAFVEKCLATVSCRLSASELLKDPFLQTDGKEYDLRPIDYQRDYDEVGSLVRLSLHDTLPRHGSLTNSGSDNFGWDLDCDHDYETEDFEMSELELFMSPDHDRLASLGIAIKGKKREDGSIFLRIRISDKEGHVRNIYFPFDIDSDTALSVATEMVAELDITDQDVTKIADMIDGEIASLVPDWKKGLSLEEEDANLDRNKHSSSRRFFMDFVTSDKPGSQSPLGLAIHSSGVGHSSGRRRFEEIIYQVEAAQQCEGQGSVPEASSSQSGEAHYTDIWAQHDEVAGSLKQLILLDTDDEDGHEERYPPTPCNSPVSVAKGDDHDNQIRKELRWLKAKYQMQLRELRHKQLGAFPGEFERRKQESNLVKLRTEENVVLSPGSRNKLSSFLTPGLSKNTTQSFRMCASSSESSASPQSLATRKSFCQESLHSHSLHRATSLPVDAVDG